MLIVLIFYSLLSKIFAVFDLAALILAIHYYLLSIYTFLFIHLLLVAILFLVNKIIIKDARDLPFYLATFLPGVGMIILSMSDLFIKSDHGDDEQLADYEKYLAYIDSLITVDNINLGEQLNIMSGLDELIYSSGERKKEVIVDFMTNEINLKVKILRKALDDNDSEIVHYSSTVLTSLEEKYEKIIFKLREKYKQEKDVKTLAALIEIYDRYINSGLLDGSLRHIYLNEYLVLLLEMKRLEESNLEILLKVTDTYILLKRFDDALFLVEECYKEFPAKMKTYLYFLYLMRIYYSQGDYGQVVRKAAMLKKLDIEMPFEYQKIVNYWT